MFFLLYMCNESTLNKLMMMMMMMIIIIIIIIIITTTKDNENLHNLICYFFCSQKSDSPLFNFSDFSWNSYICTTISNKIMPERWHHGDIIQPEIILGIKMWSLNSRKWKPIKHVFYGLFVKKGRVKSSHLSIFCFLYS